MAAFNDWGTTRRASRNGNIQIGRRRLAQNLNVVDSLVSCFDKAYAEANKFDCQPKLN